MSAARRRRRGNGVDSQLVRDALQQFNVSFNHGARRLREPRLEAKNEKWPWRLASETVLTRQ